MQEGGEPLKKSIVLTLCLVLLFPCLLSFASCGGNVATTAAPSGTVQLTGRTECDRIVVFNGAPELVGTFQRVRIVETAPFTLFGEL